MTAKRACVFCWFDNLINVLESRPWECWHCHKINY